MHILITGGTGLLGRNLAPRLRAAGHTVTVVTRVPKAAGEISWQAEFPAVDCAIHLAGLNLAAKRWSPKVKAELLESRVGTAKLLKSKLTPQCKIIITASGANAYACGPLAYDEGAAYGAHFLGELCKAWEGVWSGLPWAPRVLAMRMGMVLANEDSGLATMLPIYKLGLGGVVGSGRQRMNWVSLEDALRAFEKAVEDANLKGPVNVVAPTACTFREFNDTLASLLRVGAWMPIPGFVLRVIYGESADALILADSAAVPLKLQQAGFEFKHPTLRRALAAALGVGQG